MQDGDPRSCAHHSDSDADFHVTVTFKKSTKKRTGNRVHISINEEELNDPESEKSWYER